MVPSFLAATGPGGRGVLQRPTSWAIPDLALFASERTLS